MKTERHEVQERGIQPRKAAKGSHRMTAQQWPGEHHVCTGAGRAVLGSCGMEAPGGCGSVTGFENTKT